MITAAIKNHGRMVQVVRGPQSLELQPPELPHPPPSSNLQRATTAPGSIALSQSTPNPIATSSQFNCCQRRRPLNFHQASRGRPRMLR
ncbi:hypothetical protein HZ326_11319 [Fusarium oxysporum f. sp. albedinis]|nr:hypothetical protein HZ326_11319 [Fusarium oxysporum f. sp. albedinis]